MAQTINGREIEQFVNDDDEIKWRYKNDLEINPVTGFLQEAFAFNKGIGQGVVRSATNVAENAGVLDQDAQRDIDFRSAIAEAPIGTGVGQAIGGIGMAVPLAIGAEAIALQAAARAGFGALATGGMGLLGSAVGGGFGAGTTVQGVNSEDIRKSFGEEMILLSALSGAGMMGQMSARVAAGIMASARGREGLEAARTVSRGTDTQLSTDIAQDFQNQGGLLTPGQAQGNPNLRAVEDSFKSLPVGGGSFRKIDDNNQELLNQSVGESIGMPGLTEISPSDLNESRQLISENIQNLIEPVGDMPISNTLINDLEALADTTSAVDDKTRGSITRIVNNFKRIQDEGGSLSAREYANARAKIAKDLQAASGNQATASDVDVFSAAIDALDELPIAQFKAQGDEVAGLDFLDDFAEQRELYRNHVAVSRGNVLSDDGNVSAPLLKGSLRSVYGRSFKEKDTANRLPVTEKLFTVSEALTSPRMRPTVGNSGTATRQFIPNVAAGLAGGGAAALNSGELDAQSVGLGLGAALLPGLAGSAITAKSIGKLPIFSGVGSGLATPFQDENRF